MSPTPSSHLSTPEEDEFEDAPTKRPRKKKGDVVAGLKPIRKRATKKTDATPTPSVFQSPAPGAPVEEDDKGEEESVRPKPVPRRPTAAPKTNRTNIRLYEIMALMKKAINSESIPFLLLFLSSVVRFLSVITQ